MRITIPGVPISVNHSHVSNRHRPGQRVLTRVGREYIDKVVWATKAAWLEAGQPNFVGDLILEFYYYLPNNIRRDLDNTKKLLCDGIAMALGIDDRRFLCKDMERALDKTNPRVEIELTELGNG